VRTVKPQNLGVVTHCYEHDRRFFLSLGVLALHDFDGTPASEAELWPFLAGRLGADGAPDAGMPKERAEFLVSGSAFAPDGEPRPASTVQVRVGSLEKTLWVYGDRHWAFDQERGEFATAPEPFVRMPITWRTAFGGPGYERNPLGRGYATVDDVRGFAPVQDAPARARPLPNVESPAWPVLTSRDRPEPAGLGPIDVAWPQRAAKAGTYDAEWLETRSPGFAGDIDFSHFNIAPEDQQQESPFQGDEAFQVFGMHPDRPWLEGNLPGLAARCFLGLRLAGGEEFREVAMRLTTVWLFPDAERCLLIFHGSQEVAEDDAADVLHAVIAAEQLGRRRPVAHYRDVLARRLDPELGALHALREQDLLPEPPPAAVDPAGPSAATDEPAPASAATATPPGSASPGATQRAYARRRVERAIDKARAQLAEKGFDPDAFGPPYFPPDEPPPTLAELPGKVEEAEREAERLRARMEEEIEKGKASFRGRFAPLGYDGSPDFAALERAPAGPPRFSPRAELEALRARFSGAHGMRLRPETMAEFDGLIDDADTQRLLLELERHVREAYRRTAHEQAAAPPPTADAAAALRAAALAALANGDSLAERDLTGCDLSRLDLRGADLSGAWLEGANLAGTGLAGANLAGAVLARADFEEADLSGANLRRANLGMARLDRTRADGADFSEAVLGGARIRGASCREAVFAAADLRQTEVQQTDLSRAVLRDVTFLNHDLRGLRFAGADMRRCTFLEADVSGADFTGATLEGATFLRTAGEYAVLAGARLENARFVQACAFPGTDFRAAHLKGANLRGTRLAGAVFAGADLGGADLSECDLTGSDLSRANAWDAMFTRANLSGACLAAANLMNALLRHAQLAGADLSGANLFQADLARVRTDAATRMDGANRKRARVHPRAESA
jgi:uncharacterized protein YjbI with pentapeptide repeats